MTGKLKSASDLVIGSIVDTTYEALPRYEHDCSECLFMGTISIRGEHIYDVWLAEHEEALDPTLILRVGDLPEHYESFPLSVARKVGVKKYEMASQMVDSWNRRDQTPRRTKETIVPQIRERENATMRREIRRLLDQSTLDELQKIKFLAELISEVSGFRR